MQKGWPLWDCPLSLLRGQRSKFPCYDVCKSLKIVLTSKKGADLDEMQHYAAFHLGLHCLQRNLFRDFQNTPVTYSDPESFLRGVPTLQL